MGATIVELLLRGSVPRVVHDAVLAKDLHSNRQVDLQP